jgi:hypothetical protein
LHSYLRRSRATFKPAEDGGSVKNNYFE